MLALIDMRKTPQAVYLQTPNYTREGGSIPVTLTIADNLGVNVLLLPMGRADDGAQYVTPHCQDCENLYY